MPLVFVPRTLLTMSRQNNIYMRHFPGEISPVHIPQQTTKRLRVTNTISAEQLLTNIGNVIDMLHATTSCGQFGAFLLALLIGF